MDVFSIGFKPFLVTIWLFKKKKVSWPLFSLQWIRNNLFKLNWCQTIFVQIVPFHKKCDSKALISFNCHIVRSRFSVIIMSYGRYYLTFKLSSNMQASRVFHTYCLKLSSQIFLLTIYHKVNLIIGPNSDYFLQFKHFNTWNRFHM